MSVQDRPALLDSDQAPAVVLDLLLACHPGLMSIDELAREVAGTRYDPIAARVFVEDGIAELTASGLVHCLDRFVFASRTAIRASSYS